MNEPDAQDIRRRVLYALLQPAVRLAFLFGVPLRAVVELLHMATFQESQRRGLKTDEIAARLGVSPRKVALLSRLLKRNFLQTEGRHALPRRLEFMLWAGPLSAARMKQVLTDCAEAEVDAALAELERQGRVRRVPGRTERFEAVGSRYRLVSADWLARLDGLENLASNVANVTFARFFRGERRAFARTVSLRVREGDLERLTALYEGVLWPALVALDEAAAGDPAAHAIDLSILWAPYEYTRGADPEGDPP